MNKRAFYNGYMCKSAGVDDFFKNVDKRSLAGLLAGGGLGYGITGGLKGAGIGGAAGLTLGALADNNTAKKPDKKKDGKAAKTEAKKKKAKPVIKKKAKPVVKKEEPKVTFRSRPAAKKEKPVAKKKEKPVAKAKPIAKKKEKPIAKKKENKAVAAAPIAKKEKAPAKDIRSLLTKHMDGIRALPTENAAATGREPVMKDTGFGPIREMENNEFLTGADVFKEDSTTPRDILSKFYNTSDSAKESLKNALAARAANPGLAKGLNSRLDDKTLDRKLNVDTTDDISRYGRGFEDAYKYESLPNRFLDTNNIEGRVTGADPDNDPVLNLPHLTGTLRAPLQAAREGDLETDGGTVRSESVLDRNKQYENALAGAEGLDVATEQAMRRPIFREPILGAAKTLADQQGIVIRTKEDAKQFIGKLLSPDHGVDDVMYENIGIRAEPMLKAIKALPQDKQKELIELLSEDMPLMVQGSGRGYGNIA